MARFLAILAGLLLPGVAYAACPPIPFVFAQGAPFNATQVNTNFTALRDCTNALALDPVTGPSASTNNEITVWDGTTGKIIKNGLGVPIIHTAETPTIAADGSPLTSRNTTAFTASQILEGAFLVPPATGGKNYDGMRAIAFAPAATTINLVTGVSAYVVSDAVSGAVPGGFPTTVGLFAAGVARGDGAKVWGINTQLSDSFGGPVATTATGKSLNNEFDFNVSSPNTTILGLQLSGGAVVQPAAAIGVALQPWTNLGAGPQPKWTSFLTSNPGATNTFAAVGAKEISGTSIQSQDISMAFWDAAGAFGNLILNASEAAGLQVFSATPIARAVTIVGGSGRFVVEDGGGFVINGRIVMQGNAATFGVGSDAGYTTQNYGNSTSTTTIFGSSIKMATLPGAAGGGGLAVCVDTDGVLYKKAACP